MEVCPTCDRPVIAGDRFCASCGVALDERDVVDLRDSDVDRPEVLPPRWPRWMVAGGAIFVAAAVVVGLTLVRGSDPSDAAAPTAPAPTPVPSAPISSAVASATAPPTARPEPTLEPLVDLTAAGLGPGRIVLVGDGVITVYDLETGVRWDPPAGSRGDNSSIHMVGSTMVTSAPNGVSGDVRFIDLDTGSVGVWGDPRNLVDRWPLIVVGSTADQLVARLIYAQRGSLDWIAIDRVTQETTVLEFPITQPGLQLATPADAIVVNAGSQLVRLDGEGPVSIGSGRLVTFSSGAILTVDCDDQLACVTRSVDTDGVVLAEGPAIELPSGINTGLPVLSPDGRSVAAWEGPTRTITVTDVETGSVRELATGSLTPGRPIWTLDSSALVVTDRGDLIVVPLVGTPHRVRLVESYGQVFLVEPGPLGTG